MALTDAQYAAFIDRLIACREAEDAAKEDTKTVYAELADAGEDKTVAGLVVRQRRMTAKDRVKAELRDAAAEDGHSRYLRGKASHVRAREDDYSSDVTAEAVARMRQQAAPAIAAMGEVELVSGFDPETGEFITPDIGEEAGEAETGETLSASPARNPEAKASVGNAVSSTANGNESDEGKEPKSDRSGDVSRLSVGSGSDAPIPPSADSSPAVSDEGGVPSASLVAANSDAPVSADRTKAHPGCRDPDDCGVHGSWNFMCGKCLSLKGERQAVEAVQ